MLRQPATHERFNGTTIAGNYQRRDVVHVSRGEDLRALIVPQPLLDPPLIDRIARRGIPSLTVIISYSTGQARMGTTGTLR